MKRKYWILLIPSLVLIIISAVLLCFSAGSKEYSFSDLLSLDNKVEDFQTGGSLRINVL